ncbi:HNH endonuclease [Streptomyces sp. ISL-98]|uniref:HNH endonuclease family protein n=1 Tax=Streptomyces sp. ISL-98 TaxID=2819192 RepID=UPI001BEAFA3D|nr:HNH endonuclease family protein [Streptomyces sp. ISL-98]MBT2508535.1 HNH endonuclease [Streptomyces sp. ISL-98]
MIKNLLRAATAAALAILPVTMSPSAHAAEMLPLSVAVHQLDLADESREGYTRDKFRHWNAGQNPSDGCNTRNEVLIAEAVEPPTVGPGCKLSGGTWFSYYDATTVSGPSGIDIDHMVPLAESWDSGASAWTAQRREAYANDLTAPTSLVGVTARSNRSKSDQDPGTWMPPSVEVHCQYAAEWTGTKLRWNLTIDPQEQAELLNLAEQCPTTDVHFEPAP